MKYTPKSKDLSFKICSAGTWLAVMRYQLYELSDSGGGILTPSMLHFHKFVPANLGIAISMPINLS